MKYKGVGKTANKSSSRMTDAPLESRWLYKRGSMNSGVRYRLFELQPSLVVWRTAPGAAPSGRFSLRDVNDVSLIHSEVSRRRFACIIATERRTYHLETSVASDARQWARAVVSACGALDGDVDDAVDDKPGLELKETLTRYQRGKRPKKSSRSSSITGKFLKPSDESIFPLYYRKILARIEELQEAKEGAKRRALAAAADVAAECSDAHYDALALRSAFEREVDDDLFWQGLTSSKNPKLVSARRNSSTGGHFAEEMKSTNDAVVVSLPIGASESETTRHVAERLDDRLKGVRARLAPRLFYATRLHAMAARETRRALLAGWARCGSAKADVKRGLDHDTLSWERRWSDSAALKKPETIPVWLHLDRHMLRIYSHPTTSGAFAEDDGMPTVDLVTKSPRVAFLNVVSPSKNSLDLDDEVDDVVQAGLKRASPLWRAVLGPRMMRLERVVAHGELSLDDEACDAIAVIGAESALQDDFDDRDGATPRVVVVDDTICDIETAEGVAALHRPNGDGAESAPGGGPPWFEATFRHGRRLRLVGHDHGQMSSWCQALENVATSSKALDVAVVLDMRNAACARPSLAPKAPRFAIDIVVADPTETVYTIVLGSEEQRSRWLVVLDEAILDSVDPNRRKRRRSIDVAEIVDAEGEEELAPCDSPVSELNVRQDAPRDPVEPDRVVLNEGTKADAKPLRNVSDLSERTRRPKIDSGVSNQHQRAHEQDAAEKSVHRDNAVLDRDVLSNESVIQVSSPPRANVISRVTQHQQQRAENPQQVTVEMDFDRGTAIPDRDVQRKESVVRASSPPQASTKNRVTEIREERQAEDHEEDIVTKAVPRDAAQTKEDVTRPPDVSKPLQPSEVADMSQQNHDEGQEGDAVEEALFRDTPVPKEDSASKQTSLPVSSHPQPAEKAVRRADEVVPSTKPCSPVSAPPKSTITKHDVSQSTQQPKHKVKDEADAVESAAPSTPAVSSEELPSTKTSSPVTDPPRTSVVREVTQEKQQEVVVVREEDALEKAVRRASTCATEAEMEAVASELARLEAESAKRAASARDACVELRRRRQALSEASFLRGGGGSPSVTRMVSSSSSPSPQRLKKKVGSSSSTVVMSRRNRQSRGDAREAKEIAHYLARGGVIVIKLFPSSTNEMRFEYTVISDDDVTAEEEVEKRSTLMSDYSRWKKAYSLKTSETEWRAATHGRMRRQIDRWRAALAALEVHSPNESAVVLVSRCCLSSHQVFSGPPTRCARGVFSTSERGRLWDRVGSESRQRWLRRDLRRQSGSVGASRRRTLIVGRQASGKNH